MKRACSSEQQFLGSLYRTLGKGSLLLMDNGFYSLFAFERIRVRGAHFLIPATISGRPKVLQQLGLSDYLCEIKSKREAPKGQKAEWATMTVRVLYVTRKGFRRRRLVTSLLDSTVYTTEELAAMYHSRWHVETLFRELKYLMAGNRWHCKTVDSFHKELVSKFILTTLTRTAMADAAKRRRCTPERLSFARIRTA